MGFDDCYQLGYIQKTHGLKGSVTAFIDADYPEFYKNLESVLLNEDGSLVPFFITNISISKQQAQLTFEDISSVEQASELVGLELWLPLEVLPPLEEGQFYYHDLIGYDFFDGDTFLGKVTQVYQMSRTNLLGVDYQGTEVLVPMQEDIMGRVHSEEGKIMGNLPEGLIDIYTEES